MKLWIQWEYGPDEAERKHYTEVFERILEAALQEEGVKQPVEIELNVVDDKAIHEMNRQYRQIDRATDVLSFPLWDLSPGQAAAGLSEDEADPETGHICLGNIVLSWDHVVTQAEEYGHSTERETAFLVLHSMLHLLGYDHMEAAEEEQMSSKQKKILETLGIHRGKEKV